MADTRHKDAAWDVTNQQGKVASWDTVQVAVLMDLRDELKKLNRVFECANFLAVPNLLRNIAKNTTKKRRKRMVA